MSAPYHGYVDLRPDTQVMGRFDERWRALQAAKRLRAGHPVRVSHSPHPDYPKYPWVVTYEAPWSDDEHAEAARFAEAA